MFSYEADHFTLPVLAVIVSCELDAEVNIDVSFCCFCNFKQFSACIVESLNRNSTCRCYIFGRNYTQNKQIGVTFSDFFLTSLGNLSFNHEFINSCTYFTFFFLGGLFAVDELLLILSKTL